MGAIAPPHRPYLAFSFYRRFCRFVEGFSFCERFDVSLGDLRTRTQSEIPSDETWCQGDRSPQSDAQRSADRHVRALNVPCHTTSDSSPCTFALRRTHVLITASSSRDHRSIVELFSGGTVASSIRHFLFLKFEFQKLFPPIASGRRSTSSGRRSSF